MSRIIRAVTFDALHTIITPRKPVYVQYAEVFAPYVGVLPPESIKQSFKTALKEVQKEYPVYNKGADSWWEDVIRRTGLGAGANERALDRSLSFIVRELMSRFSSKEGYKAFDDAIPTIRRLHDELGVKVAIISNGDNRLHAVLKDLDFPEYVRPIILSEEEGIEKPSPEIFMRALEGINATEANREAIIMQPAHCLHIGDELICDYHGAIGAGMNACLLRRSGPAGDEERKEAGEDLEGVKVIENLAEICKLVKP